MSHEKLLRLPEVCEAVAMRKGGIYKAIREHRFPAPIKLGKRAVAWPESAVQGWIADRIAASARGAK
jgi:prophage regulatory protein